MLHKIFYTPVDGKTSHEEKPLLFSRHVSHALWGLMLNIHLRAQSKSIQHEKMSEDAEIEIQGNIENSLITSTNSELFSFALLIL